MKKIISTHSGAEIFVDKSGKFYLKGDVKAAVQDLEKDRRDKSLPYQVLNTCTIAITMLVTGNYTQL